MGWNIGLSDRIAVPSHSSGTITLPPSRLTLGGRQFVTSTLSRIISTDVTLVANTRYFVYAIISGGVPTLRISLSPPSTYRVSNPTAKLVTAFYSNGQTVIGFGSFISITGRPKTETGIDGGVLSFGAVGGTAGTKGASIVTDRALWDQDGDRVRVKYEYNQNSAGTAGAGFLTMNLPTNLPIDTTKQYVDAANLTGSNAKNQGRVGGGVMHNSGIGAAMVSAEAISANRLWLLIVSSTTEAYLPTGINFLNSADSKLGVTVEYAVQGWSNTPLEDL